MRLTATNRALLLVFGSALFTTVVLGAIRGWSAPIMISLGVPGLLLVLFGLVGVVPNANLKEGSWQWPAVDLQARVEHVEEQTSDSKEQIEDLRATCDELRATVDYLLARTPPPDDGMTDEQRLHKWHMQYGSTDREIGMCQMTGERPGDGISLQSLINNRALQREAIDQEELRQAARAHYGRFN